MLLTYEQSKYLEADPNGEFRFCGQGQATPAEKKRLLRLDESYFDVYGYHVISNYQELISD